MLELIQLPVLQDNYIYILHDDTSNTTAVVDPAIASPVEDYVKSKSWTLDYILNTHHHGDHVGGNQELIDEFSCQVIGPKADRDRIPGIGTEVSDGDEFQLGQYRVQVLDVPGHTRGHIAFVIDSYLFCGDTLFSLGCGRLFEGTPAQMVSSLKKFNHLSDELKVCCAHEYTLSNAEFLYSMANQTGTGDGWIKSFDPVLAEIRRKRQNEIRTVPSTLGFERQWNVFLQIADGNWPNWVGESDQVKAFAKIRQQKDTF